MRNLKSISTLEKATEEDQNRIAFYLGTKLVEGSVRESNGRNTCFLFYMNEGAKELGDNLPIELSVKFPKYQFAFSYVDEANLEQFGGVTTEIFRNGELYFSDSSIPVSIPFLYGLRKGWWLNYAKTIEEKMSVHDWMFLYNMILRRFVDEKEHDQKLIDRCIEDANNMSAWECSRRYENNPSIRCTDNEPQRITRNLRLLLWVTNEAEAVKHVNDPSNSVILIVAGTWMKFLKDAQMETHYYDNHLDLVQVYNNNHLVMNLSLGFLDLGYYRADQFAEYWGLETANDTDDDDDQCLIYDGGKVIGKVILE